MGVRWLTLVLIVVCSGQWWFRCCYHHSSVGIKCFENGSSDDQSSTSLYFWCSGVVVSRFIVVFFLFFCFLCCCFLLFFLSFPVRSHLCTLITTHFSSCSNYPTSQFTSKCFENPPFFSLFFFFFPSASSFLFFFFSFFPVPSHLCTLITTHFSRCFYYPIREFTSKCSKKQKQKNFHWNVPEGLQNFKLFASRHFVFLFFVFNASCCSTTNTPIQ